MALDAAQAHAAGDLRNRRAGEFRAQRRVRRGEPATGEHPRGLRATRFRQHRHGSRHADRRGDRRTGMRASAHGHRSGRPVGDVAADIAADAVQQRLPGDTGVIADRRAAHPHHHS